jgi:hypothetical protein
VNLKPILISTDRGGCLAAVEEEFGRMAQSLSKANTAILAK